MRNDDRQKPHESHDERRSSFVRILVFVFLVYLPHHDHLYRQDALHGHPHYLHGHHGIQDGIQCEE
jgi:hypothetical protein